jgi:hypothetical protein
LKAAVDSWSGELEVDFNSDYCNQMIERGIMMLLSILR